MPSPVENGCVLGHGLCVTNSLLRYFEFEILTAGFMKIGWMDIGASPDKQLGVDDRSYAFDG